MKKEFSTRAYFRIPRDHRAPRPVVLATRSVGLGGSPTSSPRPPGTSVPPEQSDIVADFVFVFIPAGMPQRHGLAKAGHVDPGEAVLSSQPCLVASIFDSMSLSKEMFDGSRSTVQQADDGRIARIFIVFEMKCWIV
jgi:hypothetical protein